MTATTAATAETTAQPPIWPRGVVAWALACILTIAAVGSWCHEDTSPIVRPSHQQAEDWMAQAIPGVGPKTAAATTAAIRSWKLDELPATIRLQVENYFQGPDTGGGSTDGP